jgi:peptidoglycan/LPS O-acetylase OafA/YrhL
MRFVAILVTLLAHMLGETLHRVGPRFHTSHMLSLVAVMDRGGRGVPLFFAISGFILAQPFLRQHLLHGTPVSVKAFYKRRLTRLEPPYILSLLIYAGALGVRGNFPHLFSSLAAHIFYVHNWALLAPINFVTWSLEVEVQFYILAPVLGMLYMIKSVIARRGVMAGFIVASAVVATMFPQLRISWNLPGQLQFFMIGFLLADLRAGRTESTVGQKWDIIGILCWIGVFALPHKFLYAMSPLILFAYLAVFNGPILRQVFRTQWIALTGGMCYSFYLMHMLVISTAFRFTQHLVVSNFFATCLIQVAVLGVCIYVVCTAYYILIERPCMDPKWPQKLLAHAKGWIFPEKKICAR